MSGNQRMSRVAVAFGVALLLPVLDAAAAGPDRARTFARGQASDKQQVGQPGGKQREDPNSQRRDDTLPRAVLSAVNAAVPGGTIKGYDKERRGDQNVYTVRVTSGQKGYRVVVTEDGTVLRKSEATS